VNEEHFRSNSIDTNFKVKYYIISGQTSERYTIFLQCFDTVFLDGRSLNENLLSFLKINGKLEINPRDVLQLQPYSSLNTNYSMWSMPAGCTAYAGMCITQG